MSDQLAHVRGKGFSLYYPQRPALCRLCGEEIEEGQEAVLLVTAVSGRPVKLLFHRSCFAEAAAEVLRELGVG